MSMPTWLASMSWNSIFRAVSSSMAKIWLLKLPLLSEFMNPRYWLDIASEKFVLGAMIKARPCRHMIW